MNHAASNVAEFTVSELSFALKRTVEENFEHVRVRGEISGFKGAVGSGHCYFRLKDDKACLEAVIWKTTLQRLRFKPQEGLEMVATGKLTTYPGRSNYQIVIENLEPAGEGALMALLEDRRKKLAAEGLFDAARKKPIPYLPRIIGVVTSPTGAVIRDILHRLRDRFPRHVLLWPVRVQGEGAAEEIAAAVGGFNAVAAGGGPVPRPDLLIVARGGGSIEDLWAFNEEVAVRAVAESRIPVIAAVGHETDWTLIDHAADRRAPTPTGAAEMAVPVRAELLAVTRELASRHELSLRRYMESERRNYVTLCRALPSLEDLLALPRQRLDATGGRLGRALAGNLERPRRRLSETGARLGRSLGAEVSKKRQQFSAIGLRLSPAVLARGQSQRQGQLAAAWQRLGAASDTNMRSVRRELGRAHGRLDVAGLARTVGRHRDRYAQICRLLQTLRETASPDAILAKGYALVLDAAGKPVSGPNAVVPGDPLTIRLAAGEIHATVSAARMPKAKRAPQRAPLRPRLAQDSLF